MVNGQRLIQGSSDIFLGWGELDGTHFYVRQLRDMKGGVDLEPGVAPDNFVEYCRLCGWGLALAHAKSGDPAMISGYIGKSDEFVETIVHFAGTYAEQTERDYDTLVAAAKDGRLKVAARDTKDRSQIQPLDECGSLVVRLRGDLWVLTRYLTRDIVWQTSGRDDHQQCQAR